MQVIQHHAPVPDAGRDGLANGLRLLHDLLEHEVGIAPLLRRGYIPVHLAALLLHRHQLVVEHVHGIGGQHRDLPVVHVADGAGVFQHRRHVGGDEVAPIPVTDDQGTVLPGGDEGVGIVGADNAEGVGAFDPPQAAAHSLQHIPTLIVVELQQLGHHLRVRIGLKGNPLLQQVLLQLHVVFNDAVVHQGDPPVLTDVRMGVDVVGFPVSGPAGMADTQGPLQVGAAVDHIGEHLQPALGLFHLKPLRFGPHRHTG